MLHYQDLFNRSAGAYSALSNSLWEARVIAVISCIKDKEVKDFSPVSFELIYFIVFAIAFEVLFLGRLVVCLLRLAQ